MTFARPRGPAHLSAALAALAAALALNLPPAHAADGPMDFLFAAGGQPPRQDNRAWKQSEYSALRLYPAPAGTAPSQQPAQLSAAWLRAALESVTFEGASPSRKPIALFDRDETEALSDQLAQALVQARPDQDVLLFGARRRESGPLALPSAVTARFFVSQGALQMIVGELRGDTLAQFRTSGIVPALNFGSRQQASSARLLTPAPMAGRADWVQWRLDQPASVVQQPLSASGQAGAATMAAATPSAAQARAAAPRDQAFYDQQRTRLLNLKALHDAGLISAQEYEAKRRSIVDAL